MPKKVKVTSFDHKSKMRIIEHGDIWEKYPHATIEVVGKILLQSEKTGYLKWWPVTHIGEL